MSHIVVSTHGGVVDGGLVAALRLCLSASTGHIVAALRNGDPLFDGELFVAPRFDRFTQLRNLIAILRTAGIEPSIREDGDPIDAQTLLNIMQASDDAIAEMDRLGELGHET